MRSRSEVPGLSGKEALILGLLLGNPGGEMYGLELVANSQRQLARGTVYVTLSRMEDKRFIESRQEERRPDVAGIPRRLYKVTGYGRRVFEAWQMAKEARRLLGNLAEGCYELA